MSETNPTMEEVLAVSKHLYAISEASKKHSILSYAAIEKAAGMLARWPVTEIAKPEPEQSTADKLDELASRLWVGVPAGRATIDSGLVRKAARELREAENKTQAANPPNSIPSIDAFREIIANCIKCGATVHNYVRGDEFTDYRWCKKCGMLHHGDVLLKPNKTEPAPEPSFSIPTTANVHEYIIPPEFFEKFLREHAIASDKLTEKQMAEAFKQAIACGDFLRVVVKDSGAQGVTYIPWRECERKNARIRQLENELSARNISIPAKFSE